VYKSALGKLNPGIRSPWLYKLKRIDRWVNIYTHINIIHKRYRAKSAYKQLNTVRGKERKGDDNDDNDNENAYASTTTTTMTMKTRTRLH
jgi:hypothetical protein